MSVSKLSSSSNKHSPIPQSYPIFNINIPFIIQCYVNTNELGAVLAPIHTINGVTGEHPIAYGSRSLTSTEAKLPAIHLELKAAEFAFSQFRRFVLGHKVILQRNDPTILLLRQSYKFRTRIRRRNYQSFLRDFKTALLRLYMANTPISPQPQFPQFPQN